MFKKTKHDLELEEVIATTTNELHTVTAESPEFDRILNQLERLHRLRDDSRKGRVSPDTLAMVLGNLAGIGMIVGYERTHVVTSKALGFVRAQASLTNATLSKAEKHRGPVEITSPLCFLPSPTPGIIFPGEVKSPAEDDLGVDSQKLQGL